jgi:hypothetical protein
MIQSCLKAAKQIDAGAEDNLEQGADQVVHCCRDVQEPLSAMNKPFVNELFDFISA